MNRLSGKLKSIQFGADNAAARIGQCNGNSKIVYVRAFSHRKVLPAETAELNIHFGVFFGGLGDFSESYLSSVDNFRGCMSDVRVICHTDFYAITFCPFCARLFLTFPPNFSCTFTALCHASPSLYKRLRCTALSSLSVSKEFRKLLALIFRSLS